jgi:hypothetical protein
MGSNKSGFRNENSLIDELNGKKIIELNDNLKRFILFLFDSVSDEDTVNACSGKKGQKPDLIIKINDNIKKVSVKIGAGNSVHQESIDLFMDFLSSIGISENIKGEILKFHWGDGTIDGTGKNRISSAEYKIANTYAIQLINREVNEKKVLEKFVNRVLFQGKSLDFDIVDAIYYGNSQNGHWAKREEVVNYIVSNKFDSDSIHFGPLNYQIWNRCLNFNPKTENRRSVMQVKWASLLEDIINIEQRRNDNE